MKIILYAIVPICLIGLCIFIFNDTDYFNNSELSILLIIALILLSIFLLLYFLVIIINSKLNKIIPQTNWKLLKKIIKIKII